MSVITMRNTRAGAGPLAPPVHEEDKTLYPYCMFFNGSKEIAYADSPAELLDVLVPGYLNLDERGRLDARLTLAGAARVALQAVINADASDEALAALSDEERAVLIQDSPEPPTIDFWEPEIALVLVESAYEPYSNRPMPISGLEDVQNPRNIIWLRPQDDEWDFLLSLANGGFIRLHEAG